MPTVHCGGSHAPAAQASVPLASLPVASVALAAVALAGSALAGCGGAPSDASRSDHAPLVMTAADLHVVGRSDSLAVVEDVAVLDDGTVWVQNSVEPVFVAFDEGGALVAAHGRLGGGPDELGGPASARAGPGVVAR
jgi:hypothetical protein